MKKVLVINLLLLAFMFLSAGNSTSGQVVRDQHILEVTWANDFVFHTDSYFTNGLELVYYAPFMTKSPSGYLLIPGGKEGKVYHGLTFTQHFFTPYDPYKPYFSDKERPFASYFLIGHQKIKLNPARKTKITSELQIGILGRYSGGEFIHNGIHSILEESRSTDGWQYQLNSDFAINYSLQAEKALISGKYFDFIPYGRARVGVPYTDASLGLQLRGGVGGDYFNGMEVNRSGKWRAYMFADASGRAVLYNGALQGGLFTDNSSWSVSPEPVVAEMKAGLVIGYSRVNLETGVKFISPEFNNSQSHRWGYMIIRVLL